MKGTAAPTSIWAKRPTCLAEQIRQRWALAAFGRASELAQRLSGEAINKPGLVLYEAGPA